MTEQKEQINYDLNTAKFMTKCWATVSFLIFTFAFFSELPLLFFAFAGLGVINTSLSAWIVCLEIKEAQDD